MLAVDEIRPNDWMFTDSSRSDEIEEGFSKALEVWESGDSLEAEVLLRAIIVKQPWHIDAIHHLGLIFSESGRNFEAFLCAKEATEIGLAAFPPSFSWLTSKLNWGYLSNRPFMRAYHALGLLKLEKGDDKDAKEIFAKLVSVHHNDNLGARLLLMRSFLTSSEWESALQLVS